MLSDINDHIFTVCINSTKFAELRSKRISMFSTFVKTLAYININAYTGVPEWPHGK